MEPSLARAVVARALKNEVSTAELANALCALGPMWLLYGNEAAVQLLSGKGPGDVPPLGTQARDGGFVPFVFTEQAHADAYAKQAGLGGAEGTYLSSSRSWESGLQALLRPEVSGLLLDPQTPTALPISRQTSAQLYAELTVDAFAALPTLHLLGAGGKLVLQPEADGPMAFVHTSAAGAAAFVADLRQSGLGEVSAQELPTSRAIEVLLERQVVRVCVDAGLPAERAYARDHLLRMRRSPTAAPSGPPPEQAPRRISRPKGPAKSALRERAQRAPKRPAVPPRGLSDPKAQQAFLSWKDEAARAPLWLTIERLAFELELYVPRHEKIVDGFSWPGVRPDPQHPERAMVPCYTQERAIQLALSGREPAGRRYVRLSGLEALRWSWSAPVDAGSIYVDWEVPAGSAAFRADWAVPALFPAFHHVETPPEGVPTIGLEALGELRGARGSRPEVAAALLSAWQGLWGVAGANPMRIAEGRYLPVFSRADTAQRFVASLGISAKPTPATGLSPGSPVFRHWLQTLGPNTDGVILDPGEPTALTLSALDLWVLARRAEGAKVTPAALVDALGALQTAGQIDARGVARTLAGWPQWILASWDGPEGTAPRMVTAPGTRLLAVFSDEARAAAFLQTLGEPGAKAGNVLSQWGFNPFSIAKESFAGAWFDPRPDGVGGVRVEGPALEAALGCLDELLMPRVPGFVFGR